MLTHKPRRSIRPADWGLGMTLCIAAVAREKAIIAVSDMRFDLGYTSGDGMPKMGRLNKYWAAMFAGNDASNAPRILANLAETLHGSSNVSRHQIEKLFRDEYRAALIERIESVVLSPYKLSVDEFTRTGVKRFTPEVFADIRAEMASVELGYEFLVFGFDEQRLPHIFRVHRGGLVQDCRLCGFWAIGSGDVAAVHHMMFQEYKTTLPLRTAAYYVCAAKFFAERASLGLSTHVVCLMRDGRLIGIDVKAIRKLWQLSGRARVPRDVWDRLPAFHDVEGGIKSGDDVNVAVHGVEAKTKVGTLTAVVSDTQPPTPLAPSRSRTQKAKR
jgi:hypothetical protein